ncbi:hypothetical protein MNBD_BACTEROID03-1533 [hydrothermal vent metagenome]|uniref:Uncharacterized protein n=1 Tax=hydrothermal vent metagenome TaxID=652676 RepID=A0A3B0SXC3_9ZZZZ
MKNLTALLILALVISCTSKSSTSLFNGKDLTGWLKYMTKNKLKNIAS